MRRGPSLAVLAASLSGALVAAGGCFPSFDGISEPAEGASLPGRDASSGGGADAFLQPDPGGPIADGGGDEASVAETGPPPFPATCKEAKARGVLADGNVQIDTDGPKGPAPTITVWCAEMTTADPKEYLSLVQKTDPLSGDAFENGLNTAGWGMAGGGGSTSCLCPPDLVRAFEKVRLLVSAAPKQAISLGDTTFSATNRGKNACEEATPSCQGFTAAGSRYGSAGSCIEGSGPVGRGNVDLRGTPFHIAASETGVSEGFQPVGTTEYADDDGKRKIATTHGGGSCGYRLPGNSTQTLVVEFD